jgi:tetratricopeptide (TPR) repeat protein
MDGTYLEDRRIFLSDTAADMDEGRYDDAIALADARLKRFPGDMDAHLVRASCWARMGRPAEAEETLDQWLAIVRDQSRAYEVLGDVYRREGMQDEAIRSYMRFMELNSGSGAAGLVSEKVTSLQDADISGGEDLEPFAVSDDFHTITLARLYVKQGHFRMAGEVIDKILEKDPGNREAGEYAGHVHRLIEEGWKPVVDELDRWLSALQEKKNP